MKAYTLRIDDELLNKIKYISIEENKTIREILLELIEIRSVITIFPKKILLKIKNSPHY